jgi:hypothetical protein
VRIVPQQIRPETASLVPASNGTGSHYFAARETDAAFVRVNTPSGPEYDHFLFYRGAGTFQTPLTVTMDAQERITLTNTGKALLSHFFVLKVQNGHGHFSRLSTLNAGTAAVIQTDALEMMPVDDLQKRLGEAMVQALTAEGLYPREALAMVNTWRDSWFAEDGIRVLYLLPREWTDTTLPLTLNPRPKEIVRVMVGRAEVIPPATTDRLSKLLVDAAKGNEAARVAAVAELNKLGRFADAGLFLATQHGVAPTAQLGWELLQALHRPIAETASVR